MKKFILKFLSSIYIVGFILLVLIFGFSSKPKNLKNLNMNNSNMTVKDVSLGRWFSAAIINDGTSDTLYTWGRNSDGQLGLGNYNHVTVPTKVTDIPNGEMKKLTLGAMSMGVVINDGTSDHLYVCGNNDDGQLGLGDDKRRNKLTEVKDLPAGEIKDISMGDGHSSAIVKEGTSDNIYSWGNNEHGQLGIGNKENKPTPTKVINLPDKEIKQISMANDSSHAIVGNSLYSWGANGSGQLGSGDTKEYDKPMKIPLDPGTIKQIDSSDVNTSLIINDDGKDKLYLCGGNTSGQIGDGAITSVLTPKLITLPSETIKYTSLGRWFSSAVTSDEEGDHLYMWGSNSYGQLGTGSIGRDEKTPTEITELPSGTIKKLSLSRSGDHSSAILTINGIDTLFLWGSNIKGEMGIGSDSGEPISIPTIIFPDTIKQLSNVSTSDITSNSAKISVDTSVDKSLNNNDSSTANYSLEVVNENTDEVIGDSDAIDLTTDGTKTFNLTGLSSSTSYKLQVVVVGYHNVRSNTFEFTTLNSGINSLTDVGVNNVTSNSAEVTVTTSTSPTINKDVPNYSLEVVNENTDDVVGESDATDLTTDGTKTFNLTKLTPNTSYKLQVALVDDLSIRSESFNITTLKNDISSLTNVGVNNVTMNSASINVDVSTDTPSANEDVNNYSLEVVNENTDDVIGDSDATDLTTDGTKTFNLINLIPATSYKLQVTLVGNHDVRSESFDLTTSYKEATNLEDLNLENVDAHTATFSVNVITTTNGNESEQINPYILEVTDSNDIVLGESSQFDETGIQTFTITELDSGNDYGEVKVWLKDKHSIISDTTVSLETVKESVSLLSNATGEATSYNTATISVDVAIGNNHEVEDYKLKVTDSSTNRTWISKEPLTKDGTQTIELDDLYWGHNYKDELTIEIEGLESSQISIDEFTTEDSPITPDETSFKIDDKSITKKSFVFSIGINFSEEYKSEDFDPSILTLTSNEKDLKLNFLHSGDGDIYTYKVFDLKANNVYDNFVVGIENAPSMEIKININPIKTKKNMIPTYEISSVIILIIIIAITLIMIFIFKKKNKKDEYGPNDYWANNMFK